VRILLPTLLSAVCLGLALPGAAIAKTTTVTTNKELAKLARKSKLSGSWVIDVPGVTSVSLPRLESVEGRLDIHMQGLHSVDLPALVEVGSDLFVGCDAPTRQDWERLGPIRPLEQAESESPNTFGHLSRSKADAPLKPAWTSTQRGSLSLPVLTRVGGGFAVCSPPLQSVVAPALTDVATDLQLFAGASWARVDLGAVRRVRNRVFVWLSKADLTLDLGDLVTVGGSTQLGGVGTLRLDLGSLESTAGLAITGSRKSGLGVPSPTPSLAVPSLALTSLERATRMIELRTVGGLTELGLPALVRTDRLILSDLPGLAMVHAPQIEEVAGDVLFELLSSLTSLGLPKLTSIGGDLRLAALDAPAVELPPVQTITGSLILSDLWRVRLVRGRALRRVGSIHLAHLGTVELLDFPVLEEVRGPFVVQDNIATTEASPLPALTIGDDAVRVLSAPRVRTIDGTDEVGLRIAGSAFTSLRLDALQRISGPLMLVDMPVLSSVSLPSLEEVTGRVLLGGAPALTALGLPRLRRAPELELAAMVGLKRLFAPRLSTRLKQSGGTKVERIELAPL
jgi:hypothetical protein